MYGLLESRRNDGGEGEAALKWCGREGEESQEMGCGLISLRTNDEKGKGAALEL